MGLNARRMTVKDDNAGIEAFRSQVMAKLFVMEVNAQPSGTEGVAPISTAQQSTIGLEAILTLDVDAAAWAGRFIKTPQNYMVFRSPMDAASVCIL